MKAIIIDDEEHCITTLTWTLTEYCKDIEVIATAQNGEEGIEKIQKFKPDLIFLDIEMPILGGIDMLKRFETTPFSVIFTTAYDQYAIRAIKLNALDYLLKPIDKDELMAAVEKVRVYKNKISPLQIDSLQEIHRNKIANKIALSTSSGLQFINLDELIRVEGDGNYCYFVLKDKKKILLSKKLGDAEDILKESPNFFRAHKSHIINIKFVEHYVRGEGGEIIMEDGISIALSRNKKDEFLAFFNKI